MPMYDTKPEHEAAYADLAALMGKHAVNVSGIELLAIAGNMVGKLIAMQDQRRVSPALAIETVMRNIEHGNAQVIELLRDGKGGTA